MKNIKELSEEKVYKLLIKYAIPAITGSLVFALYNIVDRMYIGKGIGAYAMTGISITFPIFTIYIAIGMLVGIGGGNLASIKLGERKKDEAEKILGNAFTLFVILSLSIMIISSIYLDKILFMFGATENTIVYSKSYMQILNFLVLSNFMAMGMNNFIRVEGNANTAMLTMLIGAILNIILDPIFIFVFKWGIRGAAYATALSNTVSAIWVIYHFTKSKKSILKLKIKNLGIDYKVVKGIVGIGISPFLLQIANSIVVTFLNKTLLNYGGDIAVAAMGIISTLQMFLVMIINGIISGAQPIIGFNYGAKNYHRVKEALKYSILFSLIISSFMFLVILFYPEGFINLFNKNSIELLNIGKNGIRIYMSFIILNAFYIVGANYFQGINQAKKSIILNLSRQLIIFLPLVGILPKYFNINGVWLAAPIADIIISIITFILLNNSFKKMKLELEKIKN